MSESPALGEGASQFPGGELHYKYDEDARCTF